MDLLSDIHRFISSTSCVEAKVFRTLPVGKLIPLPVPQQSWSHIPINIVTDLPKSLNSTLTDSSPWPTLSLRNSDANFYPYFPIFQHPRGHCDRGTRFMSRVWRDFVEKLAVSVSLTSSPTNQRTGGEHQPRDWMLPKNILYH